MRGAQMDHGGRGRRRNAGFAVTRLGRTWGAHPRNAGATCRATTSCPTPRSSPTTPSRCVDAARTSGPGSSRRGGIGAAGTPTAGWINCCSRQRAQRRRDPAGVPGIGGRRSCARRRTRHRVLLRGRAYGCAPPARAAIEDASAAATPRRVDRLGVGVGARRRRRGHGACALCAPEARSVRRGSRRSYRAALWTDFVMGRSHLRGLKQRVEAAPHVAVGIPHDASHR